MLLCARASVQAAPSGAAIATARAGAYKIFKVLDRKINIDVDSKQGAAIESVSQDIEFKNVTFSYPRKPNVKVLDCFNLTIPYGKTVALVGPSGCGKSTVVSLLQRFYDPNAGMLEINGQDARNIQVASLRGAMGFVGQEPVLFATTIASMYIHDVLQVEKCSCVVVPGLLQRTFAMACPMAGKPRLLRSRLLPSLPMHMAL